MTSGIIEKVKNEKLTKRMAQWSDLESMHKLAQDEEYDLGLHNFKLYYETSPQSWFVVVNEKQEVVAYDTYNILQYANMRHGFQLLVRDDYRGKGVTRAFNTMHYSDYPSVGNATADSLLRYKFQKFGEKLLGYEGLVHNRDIVKPSASRTFTITALDQSMIEKFLAYDRSVVGFNRDKFISEWSLPSRYPCKAKTLVAKRDGIVCGYGTIRECSNYLSVSPLYADNDIIAEWLLYELLENLSRGDQLYIFFSAKNRLLMQWVHKLNFICADCELRDYIGDVPKMDVWDMKRAYALHDYYPV